MNSNRRLIAILVIGIFAFLAFSWVAYHFVLDISEPFPKYLQTGTQARESFPGPKEYYLGVISRYPPTLIYQGYQPIIDYLNQHTPYHFALKLNRSYRQAVQQLVSGKVAAAFFGSYLFVRERRKYHLHCILKPLNEQLKPVLHADLIVPLHSSIHSVKDLKGKKVALPSPLSFSGNWLAMGVLQANGLTLADLDSVHHFAHHYTVVYEVLKGNFDAGVVKDRVAKEFQNRGIRVVAQSRPVPSSPIVIAPNSPPKVVAALKQALLTIDVQKPETKAVISHWDREFAYGFVPANDSDYDQLERLIDMEKEQKWPR